MVGLGAPELLVLMFMFLPVVIVVVAVVLAVRRRPDRPTPLPQSYLSSLPPPPNAASTPSRPPVGPGAGEAGGPPR